MFFALEQLLERNVSEVFGKRDVDLNLLLNHVFAGR